VRSSGDSGSGGIGALSGGRRRFVHTRESGVPSRRTPRHPTCNRLLPPPTTQAPCAARSPVGWRTACVALALALAALHACAQPASPPSGEVRAQLELGVRAYEAGRVGDARAIFEALSKQGVPAAAYNLAMMHLRGDIAGGVPPALALLRRAADAGFVTAMVQLAHLHEDGTATGRADLEAALGWYLKAAEAGSVEAQVEAATGYYLGRGVARDPAQAAHWYREAAKGGDVGAMYLIASMYETGLGVACDLRLALYWYAAAAEAGDAAAAAKVIELHRKAQGGPAC
jgi:TPR repeat protein